MTHHGGRPHEVGDRGQRYEVRATGYPTDEESVIGWTDHLDRADAMAASIRKAPGCTSTAIWDRHDNKLAIMQYAGLLR